MDPRIQNLKSTTFLGRRFSRQQLAGVQQTVALFPALSRRELSLTICEHLSWTTPRGDYRIQSGVRLLEQLEVLGIVSLPAHRQTGKRVPHSRKIRALRHGAPEPDIHENLSDLMPIQVSAVTDPSQHDDWNARVNSYHYLGSVRPFGRYIRYFIMDCQGRKLGCLLFSSATTRLPCRDRWLGAPGPAYARHLERIVCNARYLIFPWVEVRHLASHALALATRQLAQDWHQHHGYRPVLVETFVDTGRFRGTCYRAANWQWIGWTTDRTVRGESKTRKAVYVLALERGFHSILLPGRKESAAG